MLKIVVHSIKNCLTLAISFFCASGLGALKTDVHFGMQNETEVQVVTKITNSEPRVVRFKLGAHIKLQTLKGFTAQNAPDGSIQLTLNSQNTGIVEYSIPTEFKTKSAYFVTTDDSWIPTLIGPQSSSTLQSIYFLSSELPSNIQIIHSATGVPQDDLAFVICKCRKFSNPNGKLNIFLAKDEPDLARVLISNLEIYLEKFEKQFGPYPYDQFSVVESPDEIGYAFPKMTWIGTQLLHFPFILKTSLPHEFLHSWWGNGVFVDPSHGNWCEGLTTFGADYGLLSESDKKTYRVKAITNFLNYARMANEIPLSQFSSRGENKSLQAIGYDKALMVFVMLEAKVGKQVFNEALKNFYFKFRYKRASFEDFFSVLAATSKKDFTEFKKFWLYSKGLLPKEILKLNWQENPNQLNFETPLSAASLGSIAGFPLNITLQMPDQSLKMITQKVRDDGKGLEIKTIPTATKPVSYTFDQDFLLLRELSTIEKPVTFSQYFANQQIKVLAQDQSLISALSNTFAGSNFIESLDIKDIGESSLVIATLDQALKILDVRKELLSHGFEIHSQQLKYQSKVYNLDESSLFLTLKIRQTKLLVLSLSNLQSVSRWLQRLSHYGDKSYLILNEKAALTQGVWLEPAPIQL